MDIREKQSPDLLFQGLSIMIIVNEVLNFLSHDSSSYSNSLSDFLLVLGLPCIVLRSFVHRWTVRQHRLFFGSAQSKQLKWSEIFLCRWCAKNKGYTQIFRPTMLFFSVLKTVEKPLPKTIKIAKKFRKTAKFYPCAGLFILGRARSMIVHGWTKCEG